MAKKNSMVAFRTAFRGYKKADVNEYIERKAKDFSLAEEELNTRTKALEEKLAEQTAETERTAALLVESDAVINSQKAELDSKDAELAALREKLADTETRLAERDEAFAALSSEVEALIGRVNSLQNAKPTAQSTPPQGKTGNAEKAEAKREQDDEVSLSSAIRSIKNRILSFLK